MGNVNEQKVANNEQDDKLVIKFQIQKIIKKQRADAEQYTNFIPQKDSPYSPWNTNISIWEWQSKFQKVFEHALLRYLQFKALYLKWNRLVMILHGSKWFIFIS